MARKTPDYTRQARQAPRRRRSPTALNRYVTMAGYGALLFSAAMSLYGLVLVVPAVTAPGIDGNRAIVAVVAFLSGLCLAGLVGLMLLYYTDPGAFPLKRLDSRSLLYATVFVGIIAMLMVLSAHVHIAVLFTSVIPTLLVVSLIVRPRMRLLEGRQRAVKQARPAVAGVSSGGARGDGTRGGGGARGRSTGGGRSGGGSGARGNTTRGGGSGKRPGSGGRRKGHAGR